MRTNGSLLELNRTHENNQKPFRPHQDALEPTRTHYTHQKNVKNHWKITISPRPLKTAGLLQMQNWFQNYTPIDNQRITIRIFSFLRQCRLVAHCKFITHTKQNWQQSLLRQRLLTL